MASTRPHVQRSTKELEVMAVGADHATLEAVIYELGFRERKAAVQLRQQLQERVAGVPINSPPIIPERSPVVPSRRASPAPAAPGGGR